MAPVLINRSLGSLFAEVLPIEAIEVKKPDIDNGVKGLEHPNVLGEYGNSTVSLQHFESSSVAIQIPL